MSKIIENQIFDYIKTNKIVRTKEIEKHFKLTQATARRYLINLENNQLIIRTFGENILKEENNNYEDQFVNQKINENVEIKKLIAQQASKLVSGYKTIFIDSGSLCFFLMDYLEDKELIIFTNSLTNANKAISLGFKNVYILGGLLKAKTYSIVDIDEEALNKINFPISFIGVNGIDEKFNLFTPEKKEAITKEKIIFHSLTTVVLAERTKFDQKSTFNFRPKNKKIIFVTDCDVEANDNNLVVNVKKNRR